MCGIAAIFNYREKSPVDRSEMQRYLTAMQRRGPDGTGEWYSTDESVSLGHRRLAIIDLSENGAQPMVSVSGKSVITFNGEIYNYKELRADLESRGHRFRSTSDTEVLLELYEEFGEGMVERLRGMFTFAIWDHRKNGLFIARDHLGIKPLYIADDGKTLRLASQVKALLAGKALSTEPSPAGHVGFFLWGHIPDPYTLYRNIRALPAGSSLWIDNQGARPLRQFFRISEVFVDAENAALKHEDPEVLRRVLLDSVRHHLIADVPVGVFLSAGLDSSTLAALSSEMGGNLKTVTLGFREFQGSSNDETVLADEVARKYGTTHQTVWVTKSDFEENYERLIQAMDQPTCDGVNSFFISAAANSVGLKVALSGVGGDELFGGYPSFLEIPKMVHSFGGIGRFPKLGRGFRRVSSALLKRMTSPKYAGLLEYGGTYSGAYLLRRGMFMPWELPEILDAEIVRQGWDELKTMANLDQTVAGIKGPHLKVSALEMNWYMRNQLLRDTDWASMDHSLEIRTPLVDVDVLRKVAPLLSSPNPPGKRDMAVTPSFPLPSELINRPKSGFSVPVRDWLVQESAELNRDRGLRGWAKLVYGQLAEVNAEQLQPRKQKARPISGRIAEMSRAIDPTSRKILVFRIGQLGDTIVALPAIQVIRNQFPNAHITLLCDKHPKKAYVLASDLFQGTNLFDDFLYYPVTGPGEIPRPWHMITLLASIRKRRFDTLVYLAPSARTNQQMARDQRFFASAGIKKFIGMHEMPEFPKKTPGKPLEGVLPEVEWILSRLALDGIPVPEKGKAVLDLRLGPADQKQVANWLRDLPSDAGRPWIGIGIGAKQAVNKWPVERYLEVVSELVHKFDIWPVVVGGAEDQDKGDLLIRAWGRGYNAAGSLSVRGASAALTRCVLFLGNDTGTMHLASTAGIPCVGVYSSRQWQGLWEPYGVNKRIFRTHIECEGCGLSECIEKKNECINRIQPAEVAVACGEILAGRINLKFKI